MHVTTTPNPTAPTVPVTVGLIVTCVFAALVGTFVPKLAIAVVVLAAGVWLLTRSVEWANYGAIFLIYSNLPAVAVRFHGVPNIVGSAVVGLFLLPIANELLIQRRTPVTGKAFPWFVAFAVVQFLGVLAAKHPEWAWGNFIEFLLEGGVLYLLIVNAVRTREALRGVTWAVLIAGCLMGGVPLLQQITGKFESDFGGLGQTGDEPGFRTDEEDEPPQMRLAGPIGEKNRYAQIMLMVVPLGVFRLRDEQSPMLRGLAVVSLLLALAGVFLSFSRSTILCLGFVVAFAAMINHVSRVRIAVAFGLMVFALLLTPQYRARLVTLLNLPELFSAGKHSHADGALKGRVTEMGGAFLVFLDHPVVGVGPGQFKHYSLEYGERIGARALAGERQAHCLPLDVAAANGLLGVVCLFGLLVGVSVPLLQRLQTPQEFARNGLAASYFYMMAIYFSTGLFLHFAFIRYFWLMIALADVAIRVTPTQLRSSVAPRLSYVATNAGESKELLSGAVT